MELQHNFTVPVAAQELWPTLLDVPRIAGCLPGAVIDSSEGNDHVGRVKVKVGPIAMTYRGTISLVEADERARRIVLSGSGRETGGAGTASARIEARLVSQGPGGTEVVVHTDFDVTGKPAQFGRGMLADVGTKLIDRFAENLAVLMTSPGAAQAHATDGDQALGWSEAVAMVGGPVLERVWPAAAGVVVGAVLVWVITRR